MKNWKLIGKIATFFTVVSAVITILLAIVTYLLLSIASSGAPMECVAFYILSTIMPYLLVTIFALVVAVMSRGAETPEETPQPTEEEALPPTEPTEDNA